MPFNTALSGIRAANADLKVTGNNIANASTVGFKSSRTEFGDVYASTVLGGGGNSIGGGVRVQDVSQQFNQGNISFTENELDMAISGSGFFVVQQGGDQLYTRSGTFGLDSDGYIVNNTDARLQGFAADDRGNVGGVMGDIRIETGNQPPRLTTSVTSSLNLNSAEEVLQRSGTIFTAEGNRIGVAQVGPINETSSNLLSGSFALPLANDFSLKPVTFDVSLAGATNNNGTVSVTLDSTNGMPPAINTFNDLRTVAGVINGQLFAPNLSSQSPVDVLATAVNDGGGNYHLEFKSLIAGESSQVSVDNGNSNSLAVSDPAATVFDVSGGPTTAFSAIDPPTVATVAGSTVIPAVGAAAGFAAGDTITMTVNGTQATIDFNDATIPTLADLAAGTDDADGVVGMLNARLNVAFGAGVVEALNSNPGGAGTISFATVNTGVTQSVGIVSPLGGTNPLGLLPVTDQGSDGASFDIAVNGGSSIRVPIGSIASHATLAGLQSELDSVLDTALAGAGLGNLVNASVDAATGRVSFESTSAGANNTLQITQVSGVDILGLQSAAPPLVNTVYRGGDAASALGLPVGGSRISDSSGQAAVTNNYPNQAIDIIDPDGNTVTFTSLAGSSAAETASDMNALAGVSATASTTATLSAYTNANGFSVITLNNVALVSDTLESLETEINALTTSTLPGVSATFDAVGQTLSVTSAVGDDLVISLSSTDDGDSLSVLGSDPGGVPVLLETDPLNDGTSTATTIATPAASTPLTGSENYWNTVPAPSFDLSIDGQGFQTVSLQGINNDLLLKGTTPVAGALATGGLLTAMDTTFDLTLTGAAAGTVTVDLAGFVDGSAGTTAALHAQMQAAVDFALAETGTPATSAGATTPINAAAITAMSIAGADNFTLDVSGTSAVIDLEAAAIAVEAAAPGAATTDQLVAELNASIAASGLAGQVVALNTSTPADGAVSFEALTHGAAQVLTSTAAGIDALGLTASVDVLGSNGVLAPADVTVNLNPATNELSFSVSNPASAAVDTILLDSVVIGTDLDPLDFTSIETAMLGAPDAGAVPSVAVTTAAIQQAVDDAVGPGVVLVSLDPITSGVILETILPGSDHSLRIVNTVSDELGFQTVPNLVGSLFEGVDGANVRAEGVNGNSSAIKVGGSLEIVLDEDYSVSNPAPLADGLFAPFQTDTFQPFTINEFNPLDQATYNHSTSLPIYDSLGNSHTLTQYFVKQDYDTSDPTTQPNSWQMHVLIDGAEVGDPDTTAAPPLNTEATRATYNLSFDSGGTLNAQQSDPVLISNWVPLDASGQPNGALSPSNVLAGGTLPVPQPPTSSNFEIDMSDTSQHSGDFAKNNVDQDGFSTGRLSGIDIDDSGIIFARFTNGEAQALGQIALAEFPNVQGLQQAGNTMWAENFETGTPNIGVPGTASLGVITSGALEDSNVDLSEELVNLIIAQRNFQASSKTIETANQVTQTIINLR